MKSPFDKTSVKPMLDKLPVKNIFDKISTIRRALVSALKYFKMIWRFIPSFSRCGIVLKISISIFLAGICADLLHAKLNPALHLLKGALSFSPVAYTQSLVEKGKLKTAEEYMDFYASIPGVHPGKEFRELRESVYETRHGMWSGAMHQGKHIIKGVMGEESDEAAGQAADVMIDFTGIGDVRELYREWNKYSEGREVDALNAGLAGIGLTMTIAELVGGAASGGTAAALIEPVRKTSLAIKKILKFMNPKLKKACLTLFEPVFRQVKRSRFLNEMPPITQINKLKEYAGRSMNEIAQIAQKANESLMKFKDMALLYQKNPAAAKLVAENAGNIKNMENLSRLALKLGDEGKAIFKFGGKEALDALAAVGRQEKNMAATMKASMRVGPAGLKAVARGCWKTLDRMITLIHKYSSLLWWFMLQMILSKVPLVVAFLLELLGIAILIKTWLPSHKPSLA